MSRWDDDHLELLLGFSIPKGSDEVGSPKVARQKGWMPRIDLLETRTYLLVRVELAGVPARSVHVQYNPSRHTLTIRGERPDELAQSRERFMPHLLEIDEGSFSREILLPDARLEMSGVRSEFKNGILSILLPKAGGDDDVLVVETITVKKI